MVFSKQGMGLRVKQMIHRVLAAVLIPAFLMSDLRAYAQGVALLPEPGARIALSPVFAPPLLKGIKVFRDDPFRFDFILDKGDPSAADAQVKAVATRLIKYFLASLTVPENELWVNLSPYEKDRIVPDAFGRTEMGRDLLAQDYLLKQLTASLMYPEDGLGKKFWEEVYRQARTKFGTTDIPVDTFNKVWIMPAKAVVYEKPRATDGLPPESAVGYVVEARLKVMLESDYRSMEKNGALSALPLEPSPRQVGDGRGEDLPKDIIREIIIPVLEKEVNEGKNFAPLRQVYNSLILAAWYKKKLLGAMPGSPLGFYVDHNKVPGINIDDPKEAEAIWGRYVEAFKKGAYNFIREEYDPATRETIPRKYFAGGMQMKIAPETVTAIDASQLALQQPLEVHVEAESVSANGEAVGVKVPRGLTIAPEVDGHIDSFDALLIKFSTYKKRDQDQRKAMALQLRRMKMDGADIFTEQTALFIAGKKGLQDRLLALMKLLDLKRDGQRLFTANHAVQLVRYAAIDQQSLLPAKAQSLAQEQMISGKWLFKASDIVQFMQWGLDDDPAILKYFRQHLDGRTKFSTIISFLVWMRKKTNNKARWGSEQQERIVRGMTRIDVAGVHELRKLLNGPEAFDAHVDAQVREDRALLEKLTASDVSAESEDIFQRVAYSFSLDIRQQSAAWLKEQFIKVFREYAEATDDPNMIKDLNRILGADGACRRFMMFRALAAYRRGGKRLLTGKEALYVVDRVSLEELGTIMPKIDWLSQKVDHDGFPLFNAFKIKVMLLRNIGYLRQVVDFWMAQEEEGWMIADGEDVYFSISIGQWSAEKGELFKKLWSTLRSTGLPVRRILNSIVFAGDMRSKLLLRTVNKTGGLPLDALKLKADLVSGTMVNKKSGVETGLQVDVQDVKFLFNELGILSDELKQYIDDSVVEDKALLKEVEAGKRQEDPIVRRLFLSFSLDVRNRMQGWLFKEFLPEYMRLSQEGDGLKARFDRYCGKYRWARANSGMDNFMRNWAIIYQYKIPHVYRQELPSPVRQIRDRRQFFVNAGLDEEEIERRLLKKWTYKDLVYAKKYGRERSLDKKGVGGFSEVTLYHIIPAPPINPSRTGDELWTGRGVLVPVHLNILGHGLDLEAESWGEALQKFGVSFADVRETLERALADDSVTVWLNGERVELEEIFDQSLDYDGANELEIRSDAAEASLAAITIPEGLTIDGKPGDHVVRDFLQQLAGIETTGAFYDQLQRLRYQGQALDSKRAEKISRTKDPYARVLSLIEFLGYTDRQGVPLFDLSRSLVMASTLPAAHRTQVSGQVAWFVKQEVLDDQQFFALLSCRKLHQASRLIDELLAEGWEPSPRDGARMLAYTTKLDFLGKDPWEEIKIRLKHKDTHVSIPDGLTIERGRDGQFVDVRGFLKDLEGSSREAVPGQLSRMKFQGQDPDKKEFEKIAREPDWYARALFYIELLGYENAGGRPLFNTHEAAVLARSLHWFAREQALGRIHWLQEQQVFDGHDIYAIVHHQLFVNISSMISLLRQDGPPFLALDASILIRYARLHGPADKERLKDLRRELQKKDRSGMVIPPWIAITPEKGGGAVDPRGFLNDLKKTDDPETFARQLPRINFKGASLDPTDAQRLARGKDRYARVLFLIELLGYLNKKGEPLFDLSRALVLTNVMEEANRQRMSGNAAWFLEQRVLDEEQFFVLLASRKLNQARNTIDELLAEGWEPSSSDGLKLMAYATKLGAFGKDPWREIKDRLEHEDTDVDLPEGLTVDPGPDGLPVDVGMFLKDLEGIKTDAVPGQLSRMKFHGQDLDKDELEKIAQEPDWHARILFLIELLRYENAAGQLLFSIHEAAVLARTLRWFARDQALGRINWLLEQQIFDGHDIYSILQQQLFLKIELIMDRLKALGQVRFELDATILIRYARLTGTVDADRIQDLRGALERQETIKEMASLEKQKAAEKKRVLEAHKALQKKKALEKQKELQAIQKQKVLEKQKALEENEAPLRGILARIPPGLAPVNISPKDGIPQEFLAILKAASGDEEVFARQFARITFAGKRVADERNAVALVKPAARFARTLFLVELLMRKNDGGQPLFGLQAAVVLAGKLSVTKKKDYHWQINLLLQQGIFDGHDIYRILAEGVFEEVQWLVNKLTVDKEKVYVWKLAELDSKVLLTYAVRPELLLTEMARAIDAALWARKKDALVHRNEIKDPSGRLTPERADADAAEASVVGITIPAGLTIDPENGRGMEDARDFLQRLGQAGRESFFEGQLPRMRFQGEVVWDPQAAGRLAVKKDRYARVLVLMELLNYRNNEGEPLFDLSRARVLANSLERSNRMQLPGQVNWFLGQTVLDDRQFYTLLARSWLERARALIDDLSREGYRLSRVDGIRLMAYMSNQGAFGNDPWEWIKEKLKSNEMSTSFPQGLAVDAGDDGKPVDVGEYLKGLKEVQEGVLLKELRRIKFRGQALDHNAWAKITREPDRYARVLFVIALLTYQDENGQLLFTLDQIMSLAGSPGLNVREQALWRINWLLKQGIFDSDDIYYIIKNTIFLKIELLMAGLSQAVPEVRGPDSKMLIKHAMMPGRIDAERIKRIRTELEAIEAFVTGIPRWISVGPAAGNEEVAVADFLRDLKETDDEEVFTRQLARLMSQGRPIGPVAAKEIARSGDRYAQALFVVELLTYVNVQGLPLFDPEQAVTIAGSSGPRGRSQVRSRLQWLMEQDIFDGSDISYILKNRLVVKIRFMIEQLMQSGREAPVLDGKILLKYAVMWVPKDGAWLNNLRAELEKKEVPVKFAPEGVSITPEAGSGDVDVPGFMKQLQKIDDKDEFARQLQRISFHGAGVKQKAAEEISREDDRYARAVFLIELWAYRDKAGRPLFSFSQALTLARRYGANFRRWAPARTGWLAAQGLFDGNDIYRIFRGRLYKRIRSLVDALKNGGQPWVDVEGKVLIKYAADRKLTDRECLQRVRKELLAQKDPVAELPEWVSVEPQADGEVGDVRAFWQSLKKIKDEGAFAGQLLRISLQGIPLRLDIAKEIAQKPDRYERALSLVELSTFKDDQGGPLLDYYQVVTLATFLGTKTRAGVVANVPWLKEQGIVDADDIFNIFVESLLGKIKGYIQKLRKEGWRPPFDGKVLIKYARKPYGGAGKGIYINAIKKELEERKASPGARRVDRSAGKMTPAEGRGKRPGDQLTRTLVVRSVQKAVGAYPFPAIVAGAAPVIISPDIGAPADFLKELAGTSGDEQAFARQLARMEFGGKRVVEARGVKKVLMSPGRYARVVFLAELLTYKDKQGRPLFDLDDAVLLAGKSYMSKKRSYRSQMVALRQLGIFDGHDISRIVAGNVFEEVQWLLNKLTKNKDEDRDKNKGKDEEKEEVVYVWKLTELNGKILTEYATRSDLRLDDMVVRIDAELWKNKREDLVRRGLITDPPGPVALDRFNTDAAEASVATVTVPEGLTIDGNSGDDLVRVYLKNFEKTSRGEPFRVQLSRLRFNGDKVWEEPAAGRLAKKKDGYARVLFFMELLNYKNKEGRPLFDIPRAATLARLLGRYRRGKVAGQVSWFLGQNDIDATKFFNLVQLGTIEQVMALIDSLKTKKRKLSPYTYKQLMQYRKFFSSTVRNASKMTAVTLTNRDIVLSLGQKLTIAPGEAGRSTDVMDFLKTLVSDSWDKDVFSRQLLRMRWDGEKMLEESEANAIAKKDDRYERAMSLLDFLMYRKNSGEAIFTPHRAAVLAISFGNTFRKNMPGYVEWFLGQQIFDSADFYNLLLGNGRIERAQVLVRQLELEGYKLSVADSQVLMKYARRSGLVEKERFNNAKQYLDKKVQAVITASREKKTDRRKKVVEPLVRPSPVKFSAQAVPAGLKAVHIDPDSDFPQIDILRQQGIFDTHDISRVIEANVFEKVQSLIKELMAKDAWELKELDGKILVQYAIQSGKSPDEVFAQVAMVLWNKKREALVRNGKIKDPGKVATSAGMDLDHAAVPGGIDLGPGMQAVESRDAGQGAVFQFVPDALHKLDGADGIRPVIIGMEPLKDISEFLGLLPVSAGK